MKMATNTQGTWREGGKEMYDNHLSLTHSQLNDKQDDRQIQNSQT